jgi:hypothetical protein
MTRFKSLLAVFVYQPSNPYQPSGCEEHGGWHDASSAATDRSGRRSSSARGARSAAGCRPSHRVDHGLAAHPLEACDDVGVRVREDVAERAATRSPSAAARRSNRPRSSAGCCRSGTRRRPPSVRSTSLRVLRAPACGQSDRMVGIGDVPHHVNSHFEVFRIQDSGLRIQGCLRDRDQDRRKRSILPDHICPRRPN